MEAKTAAAKAKVEELLAQKRAVEDKLAYAMRVYAVALTEEAAK